MNLFKSIVKIECLIIIAFPFLFLSCMTTKSPVLEGSSAPYYDDLFEAIKPVFSIPEEDIAAGNGIEAIWVNKTREEGFFVFEITVVFSDEDHPSGLTDKFYDFYRSFKYHRIHDVETFRMYFDINNIVLSEIDFTDVYSGGQTFKQKKVQHFSESVPATAFEYTNTGAHPVININTWNHMFSEKRNNPELKERLIADYLLLSGTRAEVEKLFR